MINSQVPHFFIHQLVMASLPKTFITRHVFMQEVVAIVHRTLVNLSSSSTNLVRQIGHELLDTRLSMV